MGAASVVGHPGSALVALVFLATAPAVLQAQVGLASGAARITLIARSVPKASIAGVSSVRATARMGQPTDEKVTIRLSANTGYRLMVVGTAVASSQSEPATRLWVQAEHGRFVEVRAGAAVTVLRGQHAANWEPEVSFRSEQSGAAAAPAALPVRYEVRIDPAI